MEFNQEAQRLGFCETAYEAAEETSLDVDLNLPDYRPEIRRILKCFVIPNVTSVQNASGRVCADVLAEARLVYVGDDGKIAAYGRSYPVQKFAESNAINSDSAVSVAVNVDYADCRAVSPRRVDIKATLTFSFKAVNKREENILSSAFGAGIRLKKKEFETASLAGICERAFSLGEAFEIGEDKSPCGQIIDVSARAIASETKFINNKALIKGECSVKIYYVSEDGESVESAEHSMPISRIIEMEGANENAAGATRLNVTSCEAIPKADSAGNMRLIDLNVRATAFMVAFEETSASLIADAYSTEYELKNSVKAVELLSVNEAFNDSFTNKVAFESIGASAGRALAARCSDMKYSFSLKDNERVVSGTYLATVLYKDSEGRPGIIQKPVDFDYPVKLEKKADRLTFYGFAQIVGCSCAVTGDNRIELKTEMIAGGLALSSRTVKYVSAIEIDEKAAERPKANALTIYFCEKGESLWNIAKKYNSSVEAIAVENDLSGETVDSSRMILIPGARI